MIVRTWTGWTETARAEEYSEYMAEVALPGYAEIQGNLGVLMLRRQVADRPWTEFTMVSLWRSLGDVEAFAGPAVDRAVFYARDDDFLVDREWTTRQYEVYGATRALAALAVEDEESGLAATD